MTLSRVGIRSLAALSVLLLALGRAGAQSASTEISVTLVEIPVEVLHDGEPVKGLTAADFEVVEGQRPLPIVAFEAVDLEVPPEPGAPPPPPAARRHVLFFFDFSTGRPADLLKAVVAARDVVNRSLDPRDLIGAAVYLPSGGLHLLLNFTTDRAAAGRTLQGLEELLSGKTPEPGAPAKDKDPLRLAGVDANTLLNQGFRVDERNFAAEMAGSVGSDGLGGSLQTEILVESALLHGANLENRRRGNVIAMADTVENLAETLRSVQGRKYLMLFSGGFSMSLITRPSTSVTDPNVGGTLLLNHLEEMLGELRRSGWVLHAVDVKGVEAGLSADALYFLADQTGGALVEGTNDLAKGVTRAMRRSVYSYLIGVQVDDVPFDGAYHELDVRLRSPRRGTRLVHRGGYFAPVPFRDQDDVRRLADAARLVMGGEERDDLGVQVAAVPLRTAGETRPVAVVVEVPGERLLAPGAQRLGVEIYGYALDEQGTTLDFFAQSVDLDPSKVGGRLAKGGVRVLGRLDLPAGEHRLRVLARDRNDGRVSLLTVPVSVAASADRIDALFLPTTDDPWLLVRGSEPAVALHGRSVLPAAQAALPATGEAQLVVVGHGLAERGAVLRGRIVDSQGRSASGGEVELLSVTPGEGGEPDLVIGRLRAGTLPPGRYLLELRLGTEPRARALTVRPFRVSGAGAAG